jgi:hypothetical protein
MKEESARVSTRSCPACSNTNLLLFTTLNLKSCPDCFLDIPWYKEPNQVSLYCCNPNTDKTED